MTLLDAIARGGTRVEVPGLLFSGLAERPARSRFRDEFGRLCQGQHPMQRNSPGASL
jgi:hypothetical protein